MSTGPDNDSATTSDARLRAQLRLLAEIEPPKALKDRLVAAIPPTAASSAGAKFVWRWPKAAGWVGVAAAAAIIVVMAVWLLPPAGQPLSPVADINDHSAAATMTDVNLPHPQDRDIYDNNAL